MKTFIKLCFFTLVFILLSCSMSSNDGNSKSNPESENDSPDYNVTDTPAWDSVNSSNSITILEAQGHL